MPIQLDKIMYKQIVWFTQKIQIHPYRLHEQKLFVLAFYNISHFSCISDNSMILYFFSTIVCSFYFSYETCVKYIAFYISLKS